MPGGNPRLSTERRLLLFSHEDWVRIALRIEPATLEVKGEWSNHCTTEAPFQRMLRENKQKDAEFPQLFHSVNRCR